MKNIILAIALSTLSTTAFSASVSSCTVQCLVTNNLSRESVVTVVSALGSSVENAKSNTFAKCASTNSDKKQIIVAEILNDSGNRFYSKTAAVLDTQCSTINL